MSQADSVVRVDVPEQPGVQYPLHIGRGLLPRLGPLTRAAVGERSSQVMLVADRNLPTAAVASATLSLEAAGFMVVAADVEATERDKSLDAATRLLQQLAHARAERGDPIVALGGGVTGDLAGFVAASYKRGIPIVQIPTPLLAMVDASIGGKVAVNLDTDLGLLKNAVGAFHHPKLVLIDVETLESLPARHVAAGLCECLKHGLLSAGFNTETNLFAWTVAHLERLQQLDFNYLVELVTRNARVKAAVVRADPNELSTSPHRSRAILNLGHTFAHAIETIDGLSPRNEPRHAEFGAPLVHGEAVGIGLVAAAHAAAELRRVTPDHARDIRDAVESLGIHTRLASLPPQAELRERMMHDKKTIGGRLRLVLPTTSLIPATPDAALGVATVVENPPESTVVTGLDAIRA